jgi:hypothetical protein
MSLTKEQNIDKIVQLVLEFTFQSLTSQQPKF